MRTKRCIKCGEVKSWESFSPRTVNGSRTKRNGEPYLRGECRQCASRLKHSYPSGIAARTAWNVNRKGGDPVTTDEIRQLGPPTECYLCGDAITTDAELDHVLPREQGGSNRPENLAWTHKTCNRIKHNLTVSELLTHMKKLLDHLG